MASAVFRNLVRADLLSCARMSFAVGWFPHGLAVCCISCETRAQVVGSLVVSMAPSLHTMLVRSAQMIVAHHRTHNLLQRAAGKYWRRFSGRMRSTLLRTPMASISLRPFSRMSFPISGRLTTHCSWWAWLAGVAQVPRNREPTKSEESGLQVRCEVRPAMRSISSHVLCERAPWWYDQAVRE